MGESQSHATRTTVAGSHILPIVAESDRPLIECLHRLVFDDAECRAEIEAGLQLAVRRFDDSHYTQSYSSVTLPIDLFTAKLPVALRDQVRLVRVFTIKAGERAPHEEIHRNSIQRLVSFRGRGAVNSLQPADERKSGTLRTYRKHEIVSPDLVAGHDMILCWDTVPQNTWHYPEARGSDQWFGVAFHSAAAEDIIDEYIAMTDPE